MSETGRRAIWNKFVLPVGSILLLALPISPAHSEARLVAADPGVGMHVGDLPHVQSLTIGGQAYWNSVKQAEDRQTPFAFIVPMRVWF